jgi:hypothetical protein
MMNLLLSLLISTVFAASVAEKSPARPVSSKKQLIQEATQTPKELAAIIGEYAADQDPAQVMIYNAQVRVPQELKKLYTWIQSEMPTREQLLQYVKEGTQDQQLINLATKLYKFINGNSAITIRSANAEVKSLCEHYENRFDNVDSLLRPMLSKGEVRPPYFLFYRNAWIDGGFKHMRHGLLSLARPLCSVCKSVVDYAMPWMQPQYYHKSDCENLNKIKHNPTYQLKRYGEDIPEDAFEYFKYTLLHMHSTIYQAEQGNIQSNPFLNFLHYIAGTSSYGFYAKCVMEFPMIEYFKDMTIQAPYSKPFTSIEIIMFSPLQVIETEQGLSNKKNIEKLLEGDYGANESLKIYQQEYERRRKRE